MKRIVFIQLLLLFSYIGGIKAQWTGTNPVTTPASVGIGTTNPLEKLEVKGNVRISGTGTTIGLSDISKAWLKVGSSLGIDPNEIFFASSDAHIGTTSLNSLTFYTNKVARISLSGSGNVGIGTTTPKNRLDVVGTIRATEVRVEATPWPDFVFAPDYKLRPLHEVEQFIKQHNHLPDIPSEATVEADGIGLGEMHAKLLQKIEELTLYLIELKKENESLRKDVLDLKMLEVEVEKLKQK